MKIEPLGERVLIKVLQQASQTESGIYLPETAKEKPQEGEVVALGPEVDEDDTPLAVGDIVMYPKYTGTEIKIDGEDYLIMDASDILAKIHRD
ncbi:MAG TPA: co-chaperone GroES [Anaerolineae bacterium]|nr:co-chaperone GroES [Anaerolineae bacterium]HIQ12157.1 co-chaperone GroES [Caldilineales bacterium]